MCKMCDELNYQFREPICPDINCPVHPYNLQNEPEFDDFELYFVTVKEIRDAKRLY